MKRTFQVFCALFLACSNHAFSQVVFSPCVNGLPLGSSDWTVGTNKVYVECSGVKVGIGTNNPTRSLDVAGSVYVYDHTWMNGSASIGADQNAFSKFYVKNLNRSAAIQINNSGNTSNYQKMMFFEYTNPTAEILKVQNTTSNYTAFQLNANGEMGIHNGTSKIFHLGTDGMFELRNGATQAQTFRVETNGLIRGRRMKLDLNTWADYVFDENYKLMPLSEVEAFVKAEKHLPNVPSEKELKADGADVMELNKILMEKVEELTLYLIQENKEIETLKAKIAVLEAAKQ